MKCPNCERIIKEDLRVYKYRYCTETSCYIVIQKHCPYCGWIISKERVYEGKNYD